jgi:cell division protein FtsQ
VVAAGATAVVLAGVVVWTTPLLAVTEVRVTGTDLLSPAEVREAARVPVGTPMARIRVAEVAERIAVLAPVASVEVYRSWPRSLVVEVTERTAVAVVATGGGFGLLDADGVVFHTTPAHPRQLPRVDLARPGPDDPATGAALVVLGALTPELRAQLEVLSVAGPTRIRLELRTGLTVVWGEASDNEQKARVATALLDRGAAVIDVSSPEVVVLR